ncbi:MAG TPA: flavin reductase family protein [Candidatus Dormibacteraeota bacterium]|nr:flavin reductase family protein [Candidatus Dormibacteraeota bacterium]
MDAASRRTALRMLTNGLYVMTSRSGDRCGAATVTWVSQASFRPPLLMAAVRPQSNVFACLRQSGAAALHIVGRGQEEMARRFFAPTRVDGGGLNGESFQAGVTGAPILSNAPAHVECRVVQILDGLGDHALVVLEVVGAQCREPVPPLTLAESPWEYGG